MNLTSLASRVPLRTDLPDRLAHARDLWPRGTLALAQGQLPELPEAVVFPENTAQLQEVLTWAEARGIPLVPYGAGSGVCGAAAGRKGSITVDLKRFCRIGPLDREARTVECQAGVLGQHLEDWLEREGFATRHSPSSIWCSTVGGWAASRSAGQFSSKYGKFEDMVLGMRGLTPAGPFATGDWCPPGEEDLGPWMMGTEGALGIITDLKVRVVSVAKYRWLRGYRFATVEMAWDAMRRLLQEDLHPAVLRLYDPVDTRLAGKDTVQHKKGRIWWRELAQKVEQYPWLKQHALALPLSLPRLLNGLAAKVSSGCVLIAGWEGEEASGSILSRHGHALLLKAGGEDLGAEPGEHWYKARHEVSYKLAPIFSGGGFADTMEVASLWCHLPALYAQVKAAIGRHALVMAHFSHVYPEGCSIYFTFAGSGDLEVYDALWKDALTAAAAAGGTVAHHHGVGQLKQEAAGRELAGIAPMYHLLKQRLDPKGILNPGRIFPVVDAPEPPAPSFGIDEQSGVATLDPRQPAAERDEYLARRGWVLRFPVEGPLLDSLGTPVESWETRVLGCTAHLEGRRIALRAVPRSAAGPDLRTRLPPESYESLTVPILPLAAASWKGEVSRETLLQQDIRASRQWGSTIEIRGVSAPELGALLERS